MLSPAQHVTRTINEEEEEAEAYEAEERKKKKRKVMRMGTSRPDDSNASDSVDSSVHQSVPPRILFTEALWSSVGSLLYTSPTGSRLLHVFSPSQ